MNKEIARLLEILKQKRISITKFSTETGIEKDNVYAWKANRGNPKARDSEIIQNWIKNNSETSFGKENTGAMIHNTPIKDIQLTDAGSLINDQSVTNKALAIAQQDFAAAQKDIAAVNLKLTTMLEVSRNLESQQDISLILGPHLEILIPALASKFSLSEDLLRQEMDKLLVSAHLKKKVSGTLVGTGKSSNV